MCTTFTTQTHLLKCEATLIPQDIPDRRRRRARFTNDGDDNDKEEITVMGPLLEPASGMSEETKQDIWWQKDDFESFNANVNLLAQEAIRRETETSKGYKMTFLSAYMACDCTDGPSSQQVHYLKQWTKAAFSRRGLERLCIEELSQQRMERRKKTIAAVLDSQGCSSNMNLDNRAEFIKSVSECRSRGARSFAALLGEGDAFASREVSQLNSGLNVNIVEKKVTQQGDKKEQTKRLFNKEKKFPRILRIRRRMSSNVNLAN